MKTKTIVTEITHEDLVNLLSTAMYGSNIFGATYDRAEYHTLPDIDNDDCGEDKLTRMLLNGKAITIYDFNAEDEDDTYGNLPTRWDEDDEVMHYTVNLDNIKRGVEAVLDGTFAANDEHEYAWLRKCVANWTDEDSGEFDLTEAEALLQVIVFGSVIYG